MPRIKLLVLFDNDIKKYIKADANLLNLHNKKIYISIPHVYSLSKIIIHDCFILS